MLLGVDNCPGRELVVKHSYTFALLCMPYALGFVIYLNSLEIIYDM